MVRGLRGTQSRGMDNPAPPTSERPPAGDGSPDPRAQDLRGPGPAAQGPRVTREQVKDLTRLRRSRTDRHVGGVAAGVARHLDVDPILVRVAFVVAVFLGGAGLIAYGAAWILLPEDGTDDRPLGLDERNRGLALTGVGILALLAALGDWVDAFWFPWPVAIVALGVLWFVNRNRTQTPYAGGSSYPPAHPGGSSSYPGTSYPSSAAFPGSAAYPGTTPPYADPTPYGVGTADDPLTEASTDATTDLGTAYGTGDPLADAPWAAPVGPEAYARPRRPRNPRKRGPILLWFTLALIALAEGVLGVVDAAGVDVIASAYPALALGITTAVLLLGAFWGRAGGLVLVGLVSSLALAGTTTASTWDAGTVLVTPATAGQVSDVYEVGQGELVVDLSGIDDVDALDGKEVRIEGNAGLVEVVVPEGMDVSVAAEVGAGDISVFERRSDGLGVSLQGFLEGGVEAPDLRITIDLGFGEVRVRES